MPFVLLIPFMLMLSSSSLASGSTASPEEINLADQWINQYLVENGGTPRPFSFLCDGTPSNQLLAGWSVSASKETPGHESTRRVLVLDDSKTGLRCTYTAISYQAHAAVEVLLQITNTGSQESPLLENILPLDCPIGLPAWPCTLHHMLGDWNSERTFMPVADKLEPKGNESLTIAPTGGRSSDEQMPFFNLQYPGGGVVVAIGWAGQWETSFQCDPDQKIRIKAGMQHTRLRLHPGESIRTPRILLQFWQGDNDLRAYNLFRQWMLAHNLPRRKGELVLAPICGSVAETAPDCSYEEPHIRVMKPLSERGVEVFWSDMDPQQWYPIGFPDGTGTWEPDPAKYPHGLRPIGEAAHAAGLEYLLWFEPERAAPGTRIEQLHPEWLTKRNSQSLFRLDLPEARAWLTDYNDVQISEADLSWLR
jgi:alpha-galactosidase